MTDKEYTVVANLLKEKKKEMKTFKEKLRTKSLQRTLANPKLKALGSWKSLPKMNPKSMSLQPCHTQSGSMKTLLDRTPTSVSRHPPNNRRLIVIQKLVLQEKDIRATQRFDELDGDPSHRPREDQVQVMKQ